MTSYLTERQFRVKQEDEYSELKEVKAGVPQGSVLGPVLYLLYTSEIPRSEYVRIATFADDTALLATGKTVQEATQELQCAGDQIYQWTQRWKIKLNETIYSRKIHEQTDRPSHNQHKQHHRTV